MACPCMWSYWCSDRGWNIILHSGKNPKKSLAKRISIKIAETVYGDLYSNLKNIQTSLGIKILGN